MMKNKLLLLIIPLLLLIPFNVNAESSNKSNYESMNLEETLIDEGIEKAFDNYSESDKQATIYLFRGKGCSHCHSFLTYLNSLVNEYGKYFKLVSFEVWYNTDNSKLMTDVANFLDKPAGGVPYIVIGTQVFAGYTEGYNDRIKEAIMDLYKSENKYDVLEEMEKEKNKKQSNSSPTILIWNFIFILISTIIILKSINKKYKQTNERLNKIERKLDSINKTIKTKINNEKIENDE